ncbi:MAG: glycoside hydrolase [Oscillospiraceae bacterium]|nr:glycoside hydrolase [Oscillospiraceae bacterium]
MNRRKNRITACTFAAAVALGAMQIMPAAAIEQNLIIFQAEAEDCTITSGAQAATKVYNDEYPGYSGEAFVWAGNAGGVSFDVDLKEGAMYEVTTRCYSYLGDRLQNLAIDGETVSTVNFLKSSDWEEISFGYFYMPAGKHTVEIGASGSWGFMLYDTVTFGYAKMPEMNIDPTPCDPDATAETRSLMKYLTGVYGKQILTGQQEIYGSGHDGNYEVEFDYLQKTTGKLPAVRGFDFMNYNPLYGWDDNTTERAIEWATEKNGIVTACWHINVPINFTSYTLGDEVNWKDCTYKNYQASGGSFNTANILDKTTKERAYFDAAVKMLAEQLGRLQEAGVPVIFRPLHEAQGNYGRYGDGTSWFWWGDRGPEVYKELWKLLYTELTETYGLHNLIWELNLYEMDNSMEWYPGSEYVDIVGYDKYEGSPKNWGEDPATTIFLTLVDDTADTKMVSMAECDKIPAIGGMVDEGAWWLYICPWYFSGDSDANNSAELLKEFYNSDYVVTLDELPEDLYTAKSSGSTSKTTTTTTSTTTTTTISSDITDPDLMPGDVDCNGEVNVLDAVMLARVVSEDTETGITEQGKRNSDLDGNGKTTGDDLRALLKVLAGVK